MQPRYPVYIPSKGRWESRLTSKALDAIGVPYHVVIEPQEYDQYAAVIDPAKILVLPFSNLGLGSIPARNWIWEHSIEQGAARHWTMDDNLYWFARYNQNTIIKVSDGTIFYLMEQFCDRYENVAMAGPSYEMFVPRRQACPAVIFNTRIYSCNLIRNDAPYRWRGRYNEDTDLSLRMLKDGWVTVQFNAFLQKKVATMRLKGGNTDELYRDDGRLKMAQSLVNQHPDVTSIKFKWGRWQHQVDYRPFKRNKLIRKPGLVIPEGPNEYGMKLVQIG